nr:amidohydrolase [Neobacillus niacini]
MIETLKVVDLFDKLEEIFPELVQIRRDFHMHPELGYEEVETPKKVAKYLGELGLEVRTQVGGRGVVGILRGGRPGKTVALRADFDALPIQDEKQVEYKSRVPGVMHACGHDLHTAALLGVAKVLSEVRDSIEGNVVFIHQFAEEKHPGGALPMIEDNCLEDVDVIYSAHVLANLPYETVGIKEGYLLASADEFEIEIIGKGGHAAHPYEAIDPIVLGSQIIMSLQQIVSRRIKPMDPAVVSVCTFHSGDAHNVIPHSAKMTGSVRAFNKETRIKLEESIKSIVQNLCDEAGATVKINYLHGYPSVYNDPVETKRVERVAKSIFSKDKVIKKEPFMAADDFAYFLEKVPGVYVMVGGRNDEIGASYPHHHPMFDVDERAILTIGKVFISSVVDYLSE